MKFLVLLIIVAVSCAAGYLFEPSLRMQLTGKPADFEKPDTDSKGSSSASKGEDEIPFELNPVVSNTPPDKPTTPPVIPTTPETQPTDPPIAPATPTTPPEVVVEQPETPATTPDTAVQTADPVLVMKASIASGDVSKFSAAQVLEWKAGASTETIDGETYQIGNVTYQAETPFGTKNLPAKALIKNGKVVRWISPKSGMKID